MRTRATHWIVLTLALGILLLAACGTLQVQIEPTGSPSQAPATPLDTATPLADAPTATANPATPTPARAFPNSHPAAWSRLPVGGSPRSGH